MKKIAIVSLILLQLAAVIVAEGQQDAPMSEAKYTDGVYFAQESRFGDSGWKYNVTLEVKDSRIVSAIWNGANVNAGKDKVSLSRDGEYGMGEKSSAPWFQQAEAAEQYLLETQDPAAITYKDEKGHTDDISGASIHVKEFFDLAETALSAGPAGYGPYKDGTYHAEMPAFDQGFRYFVDITVTSGYIVGVNWDGLAEDGGKNKAQRSEDGEYGMGAKASAPWFEQNKNIEEYLLSTQEVTQPDAISGASIKLEPFYELVNQALAGAER